MMNLIIREPAGTPIESTCLQERKTISADRVIKRIIDNLLPDDTCGPTATARYGPGRGWAAPRFLNPPLEVEHFSSPWALGAALLIAHLYEIGSLDHAAVPAAIAALVDVVGVERGLEDGFGAAARAEPRLAGQPLEIRVLEPVRRQIAPIKHNVDLAALLGYKVHGSPLIDVGVTTVPMRPVGAGICEPTLYPDSGCVGLKMRRFQLYPSAHKSAKHRKSKHLPAALIVVPAVFYTRGKAIGKAGRTAAATANGLYLTKENEMKNKKLIVIVACVLVVLGIAANGGSDGTQKTGGSQAAQTESFGQS